MTEAGDRGASIGAFFDMDKTLLTGSSSLLWLRHLWRLGELPLHDAARIAWLLVRYRLGRLDMTATTRELAGELRGLTEVEQAARVARWVQGELLDYVSPEGLRWLRGHRRLGHRVILITGSPAYTAEALAAHLDIGPEDVLATRFEVVLGRFTGRMLEPMCYGRGKLETAAAHAERFGLSLKDSFFYSDSVTDLPLLEQVGHPVAVNPDQSLQRIAEARGWTLVRFY